MSPRCEAKERPDIRGFTEPLRIIDKRDKAKRHDWTDARDSHQAARDGVAFGLCLQGAVEVSGRLAQRGVGGDKPVCDGAQNWVGLASSGKLIAKTLPLLCLTDASHTDTKGLEDAPDVAFQILAQSDHTAAGQEAREGLADANARLGALEDVISNLKADREAWRAQAEVLASRPRGVLAKIFRR